MKTLSPGPWTSCRWRVAFAAAVLFLAGCGLAPEPTQPSHYVPPPDAASFKVRFETSKGDFVVEVYRDWAPVGVKRFRELVESGFFDDSRFFRVVPNYVVQFGLSGRPEVDQLMSNARIPDDPVLQSNLRGAITFATTGPGGRACQVFINLRDNKALDRQGFAPFGKVIEGMEKVVDRLWSAYGDWPPRGNGPLQPLILRDGNRYLDEKFPRLDRIERAEFVHP